MPNLVVLLEKAIHRRAPKGGLSGFQGGQFLPASVWQEEKQRAADALPLLLESFGEKLQFYRAIFEQNAALRREGRTQVSLVPFTTIEARIKTEIRDVYARAFLYGKRAAGNLTSASPDEQDAVKGLRRDEFQYLRNFLSDMEQNAGQMDYAKRMDYYRAAARELYWLGFVLGNQNPDRRIRWVNGPTEHCKDCLRFAAMGAMSVKDFIARILEPGYLPQSGKLACLGYHCQCRLEEA